MDYKEKYNKLVEAVKVLQEANPSDEGIQNWVNDNVPELRESENEKTRKEIVNYLKKNLRYEWATWLEKQGSNLVKNGYTNNKDVIEYASNYSREIWHKLMDNFKNIKDYHIGCNDVSDIVLNAIINTYNWLEKQGEQKSAEWSKEDDVMVHDILGWLPAKSRPEYNQRRVDWLKSLKGRVQPVQEWSKEDDNCLSTIIAEFSKCAGKSVSKDEWMRCNDFLNSLRDRVYPKQEWSEENKL